MKQMMVLMSLVSAFAFEGIAVNLHWVGVGRSGVGDFEDPASWVQGQVAGIDDLAAFNNNEGRNFVVTFNSDVTNATMSLRVPTPEYETLFVMNQHIWTATNNLLVYEASGGSLTFTNGTLRTKIGTFSPVEGSVVTNLILLMKDVNCEMTNATFGATTASFEGGHLQLSDYLSVGVLGRSAATVKLDRGVQCNVMNSVLIGSANGATGELINVNGALCINGPGNALNVGKGGYGVMTLQGGSTYIPNNTVVSLDGSSVGHLTVTGGSNTFGNASQDPTFTVGTYGKGSMLVAGGTNIVGGSGVIGGEAGCVGEITVTNGLMTIGRFLYLGRSGAATLNIKGGEMRFVNAGDPLLIVARYAGSTGVVNVVDGVLDVNGRIWLGSDQRTLGRLTLSDNGVLKTKTILENSTAATSQVLFDGGTLQAAAAGMLIQALDDVRLTANGMVVNTAGYDVSIVPMLQDAVGEAGAISKKGAGTLTLTGTRAATGPVSVLRGTLIVGDDDVAVSAGISRIDGVLSLAAGKRLIVAAGAALAGTGSVERVTLADNAVLARSKTDNATAPLNVSDCVAAGHLTVALSGYTLADLLTSLPLLKVPTATFVKPTSMSVTLDGVAAPSIGLRYTESGGATILSAKHNIGTMILVY